MQKIISLHAGKIIIGCTLAMFILNGCTNPFNTRDIEDPEIGDNTAIYDPPVSSNIVLSNFKFVVKGKKF